MNKIKNLAVGLTIAVSLASAVAAPSATRHSKLLSVKQRVMINTAESRTSASLVSPTAHSTNGGVVVLTNSFAAVPLPAAEVQKFQDAGVPRFNYEAFWIAMEKLQACENALGDKAAAYTAPTYGGGSEDSNSYMWYTTQQQPGSAKTYANQIMANYPAAVGTLPIQYQSPPMPAECNNGGQPADFIAAAVARENVSNYSLDSPEVLDYVTSQFWIKGSNAAARLKAAVVQYLRQNEIDSAWVDVEFEYTHNSTTPAKRRISMSFQINRADEPTTRGSYLGSQLVLAPEVTLAESKISVRANHIDIKYSAYTQYPDFTLRSPGNSTYLKNLMVDKGLNANGLLSWSVVEKSTSAISPRICSGISNCTPTAGQFTTTSGAYDPDFARAGFGSIVNAPYTLEHPGPIEDLSGIKCLVKGTGSTRCRLDKQNAATLMQYANAISGTLDYVGRWEVDFAGKPPTFQESGRGGVFDVCWGVEFQNTIIAGYWVRRPRWKLNLYWQASGVDYQFATAPYYEFQNIAQLPNPVTYTTYPTGANGYNLVGTEQAANIRANNQPTLTAGAPSNYAAVNLTAYDPQTFGLPDRQGAIMINPFVSSVSSTGVLFNGIQNNWMIYRPIGTLKPEETVAASMRSEPGTPIYKTAGISASNALPRGWLSRGNQPQVRTADFNCVDQNEPGLRDLMMQQQGVPTPTRQYNSPPPDPILPTGMTPYSGTVSGHKSGTRTDVNYPGDVGTGTSPGTGTGGDPCQLSYVPWSSVQTTMIRQGPLPDPNFVSPASCTPATATQPSCMAPVNFYMTSVRVDQVTALTYITAKEKACYETCEIGGAVKLCPRPYPRFNN